MRTRKNPDIIKNDATDIDHANMVSVYSPCSSEYIDVDNEYEDTPLHNTAGTRSRRSSSSGSLPNKYAKLMHFGFWLLENASISSEERNDFYNELKLFSDLSTQAKFYDTFYSDEKETAKTMRKFITETLREQRKAHLIKDAIPIGRDQLLRDAFIDNIITMFICDRVNNFALPCRE